MRSDHTHFRSLNAAILKMQSEDYQSPERARQTYATGVEGSKQDTDEKRSKKVYGKDGKVLYASLANLRRSLNKKNKKVAESVEAVDEYTELLESVLLALCEELELDPNELLEDFQTPARAAQSTRMINKAWLHANTSESNKEENKRNRKYHKIFNKREMESKSKKTYGMGGRIVTQKKSNRKAK